MHDDLQTYSHKMAELVKWRVYCDCFINKFGCAICRHEVNSLIDGIDVDDCEMWGTIIISVRFYFPESSVFIRFHTCIWIPLNQSTWILLAFILKWNKRGKHMQLKNHVPLQHWDLNWWEYNHIRLDHLTMMMLHGYVHSTFHGCHWYHLVHRR